MASGLAQGLKAFFTKQIDDASSRTYDNLIPEDDITPGPSGSLIVKGMDDSDVEALNAQLKSGGFEGGLDLGRIGQIFESDFSDFNLETVLTNIKENNKELFNHLKRDKKSMEQMINNTGFEKITYQFLQRKRGEVFNADDTLSGIVALIQLGKELQFGAKQAKNNSDPEARLASFKKLKIMAAIQSNLAAQVSANVSESARSMAVVRNISKLQDFNILNFAESVDQWVQEADEGMVDYHLEAFLQLTNPVARAKYAEKGFASKTWDFAMENYINAMLSSPTTHMINIAGNASFQVLSLAERGVAGMIGNVRTLGGLRGEVGDQRYMGEAAAEAHGLMMAQKDALLLMAKTFVTGEGGDLISKIDLKNRRAVGSTDSVTDVMSSMAQGDFFKAAIDLFGISTRLPGRFLATEDEYFKVITMRRVLYREAHRASQIAYTTARKNNIGRQEAKQLAEQKYVDVMTNTPQAIREMMTTEARKMTFQGAPEGFFGQMANSLNHFPIMKVVVPFVNTPTNVVKEGFDRTLNWSPIYRAIKQTNLPGTQMMPGGNTPISGQELDDALAKLAVGNAVALTMYGIASGEYGDDLIVVGSGPSDFGTQINIMGAAKVPPYSIGLKQEDGTYKFTTFSRLDPMSALLAMGADMAEYARYEDDPNMLYMMGKAYTLAAAEYATNMPFLQGIAELQSAVGGSFQTKEDIFERMMKWAGGQGANVGTSVIGNVDRATFGFANYATEYLSSGEYSLLGATSFSRLMERMNNPQASNVMLPEGIDPISGQLYTEVPVWMQGFYSALQKAKSGNPNFSQDLPVGLDFWGKPRSQGKGTLGESFSPFRVQEGGYSELDQEIIRLSEIGAGSFSFHSKRVEKILLNNNQFNDLVYLINNVDGEGRQLGEPGFDSNDTLVNALNSEISSSEYNLLPTDEDKFDALNSILSERRSEARRILIGSDTRLQYITSDGLVTQ